MGYSGIGPVSVSERRALAGLLCFLAAILLFGQPVSAAPARATPLPGAPTLSLGPPNLAAMGYVVEEFVVAGTATSYREVAPPDAAGRWNVQPADSAPYVTRIVVVRPARADKFNGTVMVEWLNVSGGLDVGPVWNMTRREMQRSGWAYVAVSAQRVGIEGGPSLTAAGQPLKKVNPQRYGQLSHPGDAFSYDLFSQVGALVKDPSSRLLGTLKPRQVIAVGESQSAGYLTTYVNAVDPSARVFDGFLIHSRSGTSARLTPPAPSVTPAAPAATPAAPPAPPRIVKLRSDLRVPVLTFLAETDVIGDGIQSGYVRARQPDSNRLRAWEVAGTAHADAYMSQVGGIDTGSTSSAQLAAAFRTTNDLRGMKLAMPFNNAPQHHYVLQAGLSHLRRWVAGGAPPPSGPQLSVTGNGTAGNPIRPALDAQGNAQGGIRSPWMDVPTGRLSGVGNTGAPVARLYGLSDPFDAPRLARLYPGGKAEYLRKFETALDAAIKAGFILATDKKEIMGLAAAAYGAP